MQRDLGRQPIADALERHAVTASDLVAASTEQLTHKMVARASKGRRLTERVMAKVVRALNAATGEAYAAADLFDYRPSERAVPLPGERADEPGTAS